MSLKQTSIPTFLSGEKEFFCFGEIVFPRKKVSKDDILLEFNKCNALEETTLSVLHKHAHVPHSFYAAVRGNDHPTTYVTFNVITVHDQNSTRVRAFLRKNLPNPKIAALKKTA